MKKDCTRAQRFSSPTSRTEINDRLGTELIESEKESNLTEFPYNCKRG